MKRLIMASLVAGAICGMASGARAAVDLFPRAARAGDTVLLLVGSKQDITRGSLTVTITPADGNVVTLLPNDPAIRALVRQYPDPASKLIVDSQQASATAASSSCAKLTGDLKASQESDCWTTAIYLDLPASLATGHATIKLALGETPIQEMPVAIEILSGTGAPTPATDPAAQTLRALERGEQATVTFISNTIPYALQVELTHQPGGKAWVVNPRGDLKNLAWSEEANKLKVLITPAASQPPKHLSDFRFYVAGGVKGLQVTSIKAYDKDGNRVADVTAKIE